MQRAQGQGQPDLSRPSAAAAASLAAARRAAVTAAAAATGRSGAKSGSLQGPPGRRVSVGAGSGSGGSSGSWAPQKQAPALPLQAHARVLADCRVGGGEELPDLGDALAPFQAPSAIASEVSAAEAAIAQGVERTVPPSPIHKEACSSAAAAACEGQGRSGYQGEGFRERGADGAREPEDALPDRAESCHVEGQEEPTTQGI